MRQHSNLAKDTAEKVVKDIRRTTRKQYSAEEKIRIVFGRPARRGGKSHHAEDKAGPNASGYERSCGQLDRPYSAT